jgi:lipopolysaccharide assembly outer membrane protein LptD (OstA)
LIALLVVGCAAKDHNSKGPQKDATTTTGKTDSQFEVIRTHLGEATDRGSKDERLWTIFWVDGDIDLPAKGPQKLDKGTMTNVHGQIYKEPVIASTFKAKHGSADREAQILTLTDQVEMKSNDPDFTVTCDKVIYDAKKKIIKAIGHVHISGTLSTVGTIDELWATPDFKKIASPSLFEQP